MGLSIHYSSRIRKYEMIEDLTEEVIDVCRVMDWDYHLFDDKRVKGICFNAPECEPVFLTFSPQGELCSPILLQYDIHPATQISTKTQYAGMSVHRSIIKLFRHLEEKFFSKFEMMDESGYWETNDEKIMEEQFERYNTLMGMVSAALSEFEKVEGESSEAMTDRLEQFLRQRFGEGEE